MTLVNSVFKHDFKVKGNPLNICTLESLIYITYTTVFPVSVNEWPQVWMLLCLCGSQYSKWWRVLAWKPEKKSGEAKDKRERLQTCRNRPVSGHVMCFDALLLLLFLLLLLLLLLLFKKKKKFNKAIYLTSKKSVLYELIHCFKGKPFQSESVSGETAEVNTPRLWFTGSKVNWGIHVSIVVWVSHVWLSPLWVFLVTVCHRGCWIKSSFRPSVTHFFNKSLKFQKSDQNDSISEHFIFEKHQTDFHG